MGDYSGDYAVTLPNLAPAPGQVYLDEQRMNQQKQLREDQIRSQREAKRLQLVNLTESKTDPAKFLVGEGTIDQHTTGQLQDVQNTILRNLKANPDADPADVAMQINQAVTPIAVAHAKMKGIANDIDKNLALAKSDLPILNDGKLRELARKAAFTKTDANGNTVYRDPEEMNGNTNYVQNIINNSPESVVDSAAPFTKYLQGFKTNDVSAKQGSQYAGVRVKNSYKAQLSPFREMDVSPDGTVNGLKYKSEDVKLPDGNSFKVVPEEQFQLATGDPNAKLAFYKLWNENKKMYGVGNLPNDAPESQVMQRKFMLDYLRQTNIDHSTFTHDDEQSNNKAINDIQAGLGTTLSRSEELAEHNSKLREDNWEKNEQTRQQNRKDLKTTPGAVRPTTVKKTNKYGI